MSAARSSKPSGIEGARGTGRNDAIIFAPCLESVGKLLSVREHITGDKALLGYVGGSRFRGMVKQRSAMVSGSLPIPASAFGQ